MSALGFQKREIHILRAQSRNDLELELIEMSQSCINKSKENRFLKREQYFKKDFSGITTQTKVPHFNLKATTLLGCNFLFIPQSN